MSDSSYPIPLGELLAESVRQMPSQNHALRADLYQAVVAASMGKILNGENVYVLYADVLGFRDKLEIDSVALEHALEIALLQTNSSILIRTPGPIYTRPDGSTFQEPIVGLTKLNPSCIFSDSVFVVSHDDSIESLRQIVHLSSTMFVHFFNMGLPLRGAIALGRVWWNRNTDVRLGEGIKRAYELAESLDCIGIAIDNELPTVENSTKPIPFTVKEKGSNSGGARLLRAPLQLRRNSLSMAFLPSLVEAFDKFSAEPENSKSTLLRKRYAQSAVVIEAMAGEPIKA